MFFMIQHSCNFYKIEHTSPPKKKKKKKKLFSQTEYKNWAENGTFFSVKIQDKKNTVENPKPQ